MGVSVLLRNTLASYACDYRPQPNNVQLLFSVATSGFIYCMAKDFLKRPLYLPKPFRASRLRFNLLALIQSLSLGGPPTLHTP
jgi:hypothetical protein